MSATRESTVSSSVSTSTGEAGCGDGTFSQSSYSSETTVCLGDLSAPDGGGLGLGIQADATAFGTDTLALLGASATVSGGAAQASVEAIAAAQSPDDSAFALANVVIDVFGDAEVYLGITHSATYTVVDQTGMTTVSEVSASVTALDCSASWSAQPEPASAEYSPQTQPVAEEPFPSYLPPECGCGGSLDEAFGFDVDIEGNLAVFDITANAFGQDTLADVSVDAFVVEDQVSTVTAVVVVAIG